MLNFPENPKIWLNAALGILFLSLNGCSSVDGVFSSFWDKDKSKEFLGTAAETAKAAGENPEEPSTAAVSKLAEKAQGFVKSEVVDAASSLIPNWEIEISDGASSKTQVGLSTIRQLIKTDDIDNTVFWQGSASNRDSRTTVNLGVGYRHLSDDHRWLSGLNFFYDHEFPYNHQRASVGVELKSSAFELSSNFYEAISGWKKGKASKQEHALDGYDIEVGSQLPYIPSAKLFVKQFKWNAVQNASDLKGKAYSVAVDHVFGNGWSVEAGRRDYETGRDDYFVSLTYSIQTVGKRNAGNNKPFFSDQMFETASMENRRLDKVRRENKIVTQTAGFTVKFR